MKKIIRCLLTCLLVFLCTTATAQEDKKVQIAKAVTDYFELERENIHVHFDKNIFATNEAVWFKGYVFHRKKNLPFFSTVNVYAELLDEAGNTIDSQLAYSNIGSFTGSFKLDKEMKPGRYYVRFFTNWMNNFTEDESYSYPITIVNEKSRVPGGPDYSKVNIEFRPEGGTLVQGVTNSIGISIQDCNLNPTPAAEVDIVDTGGKLIKKVQINKMGYGKFDIPVIAGQAYRASVTINGTKHEQALPLPQLRGVALEVNNYTAANKVIIKIRTNKATDDSLNNDPLYLLVHQDEKASVFEIAFDDSLEETIVLSDEELSDGVNSLRIIDSQMNELAERLIYKYPKSVLTADITKVNASPESYELIGKVNYPNMNMSISVLPENTLSLDESNDIYGSLLISPYIENNKKASGKYYLSKLSRGKHYELDLFLLNQKNKYGWSNIKREPPKSNYTFDMGLSLKGTLPPGDNKYLKVRLYSFTTPLEEITEVNDKNEFFFHNLVVPDSASVKFSLLKPGAEPKDLRVVPQVLNGGRKFYKKLRPLPHCEADPADDEPGISADMPKIYDETIVLEEVKIEGKTLKYATMGGNSNMRGYKISEKDIMANNTVINYIRTQGGFNVVTSGPNVSITSRTRNSLNAAQATPAIYIDNIQIYDISLLSIMRLDEVDEIYLGPHVIVPSVRNFQGVIKIYRNKNFKSRSKSGMPDIIIPNGFTQTEPFENVTYLSTTDKGFENFGLIDWHPHIMSDDNGEFKLSIPKPAQKSFLVLIEGFSADGKLISELRVIELN